MHNHLVKTRVLAALAVIALAGSTFAPVQETTALAFKLRDGLKITVKAKTVTDLAITGALEQTSKMTSDSTQVAEFGAEKEAWFPYTMRTTELKGEGGEIAGQDSAAMYDAMRQVVIRAEVNAHGESRNMKMEGPEEATAMMSTEAGSIAGFLGLVLPKNPVKPGDTWKVSNPVKPGQGGMMAPTGGTVTQEFQLLSVEVVDGKTIAKIQIKTTSEMTVDGPTGEGTVKGSGNATVTFDVQAGMITAIDQTATSAVDLGVAMVTTNSKITTAVTTG